MNRRDLLKKLVLIPIATAIGIKTTPKFAWDKLYVPHPAQEAFFNMPDPVSLYGIPYHESNACAGTWCGFDRANPSTIKAMQELVNTIQNSKEFNA